MKTFMSTVEDKVKVLAKELSQEFEVGTDLVYEEIHKVAVRLNPPPPKRKR